NGGCRARPRDREVDRRSAWRGDHHRTGPRARDARDRALPGSGCGAVVVRAMHGMFRLTCDLMSVIGMTALPRIVLPMLPGDPRGSCCIPSSVRALACIALLCGGGF